MSNTTHSNINGQVGSRQLTATRPTNITQKVSKYCSRCLPTQTFLLWAPLLFTGPDKPFSISFMLHLTMCLKRPSLLFRVSKGLCQGFLGFLNFRSFYGFHGFFGFLGVLAFFGLSGSFDFLDFFGFLGFLNSSVPWFLCPLKFLWFLWSPGPGCFGSRGY